jgi:hypothetical protein
MNKIGGAAYFPHSQRDFVVLAAIALYGQVAATPQRQGTAGQRAGYPGRIKNGQIRVAASLTFLDERLPSRIFNCLKKSRFFCL